MHYLVTERSGFDPQVRQTSGLFKTVNLPPYLVISNSGAVARPFTHYKLKYLASRVLCFTGNEMLFDHVERHSKIESIIISSNPPTSHIQIPNLTRFFNTRNFYLY